MDERLVPMDWFDPEHAGVNCKKPEKVERIAASMREHGWKGRPLLTEKAEFRRLVLWTGSHRIVAAHAAGLPGVPCRIIDAAVAKAALDRLPDTVGYSSLRAALSNPSNGGGVFDKHRLAGLVALGMDEVAAALREEIGAEEW